MRLITTNGNNVEAIVLIDPTTDLPYVASGGGGGGGGSVSIDQTTPGTTDSVTVKASAGIGSLTETAPASDTASSGLNGRLQRIAQRLTSLIALLPTSLVGGRLDVNLGSITPSSISSSSAYETSRVAKASAGTFIGVYGYNSSASDLFIQIHDSPSLPVDASVPIHTFKAFAGDNFFFEPKNPITMSTGITICNSTTGPTKTIDGNVTWFTVEYN